MAACPFSRDADIADNATDPPARNEYTMALCPNLVELTEKMIVTLDVSHLSGRMVVLLERPVWRRSHDEMHGFIRNP
jgi:hypothetical protein